MDFLVQYPAGLTSLVENCLQEDLGQVVTVFSDDSAMIIKTNAQPSVIKNLPYIRNAFVILGRTKRGPLATSIPALVTELGRSPLGQLVKRGGVFRAMASIDGELVSFPKGTRTSLERAVSSSTGARVEARGGAGEEYWVIGRRDLDSLLLGLRLPARKAEAVPKGALGTELAELLVRAASPRPGEVGLDPFGGSGSIVLALLGHRPAAVVYSDTAYATLRGTFRPLLARTRDVTYLGEDARFLPSVEDASIDYIVTDPPWGEHESLTEDYASFAAAVTRSFHRVLKPSTGRVVVLVSRQHQEVMRSALVSSDLPPRGSHEVLVNGHPATALIAGAVPARATTAVRSAPQQPHGQPKGLPRPTSDRGRPKRARRR